MIEARGQVKKTPLIQRGFSFRQRLIQGWLTNSTHSSISPRLQPYLVCSDAGFAPGTSLGGPLPSPSRSARTRASNVPTPVASGDVLPVLARASGNSITGCPSYDYGLLGFGRSVPRCLVGVYCLVVEAERRQGGRVGHGGLSVGDLEGISTSNDGGDQLDLS